MHAFNSIRDDISVCSSNTTAVSSFRRNFSLTSRVSSIHFRDDLSEYSFTSSAGEGPGILYIYDYRISPEGLVARRTVAEAILRAEWEKQLNEEINLPLKCATCLVPRRSRSWMRPRPPIATKPQMKFTWSEVQSIVLLPVLEHGPHRVVVTTFRMPEEREWLLQANNSRARARWCLDALGAVLHTRTKLAQDGAVRCCGQSAGGTALKFFMDAALVACEAARCQPSPEGMRRLAEVLDSLVDLETLERRSGGEFAGASVPHIPLAALQRFSETVRNILRAFLDWQRFRLLVHLVKPPEGLDVVIWKRSILPLLARESWSEFPDAYSQEYPKPIDHQLGVAAERCRRTLS
eukprot:TRINITY_DN57262_c0_g1_i1.p1 TRINITY_DN57262_c0_g1~~TRINITY_DN57262_c0_g1_i1.p1  ORF type:complete len:350 (-),score=48.63 TRINITY_DN57262_c0_g1_i1:38-1087(-)